MEAGRIVLVTSLVSVTSQPIEGPLGISLSRPTRYAGYFIVLVQRVTWYTTLEVEVEVLDYIR